MARDKKQPSPKNIASLVESLVREKVESLGYVLWDVEYAKEGVDWNLTIFIDSNDREIGIDDCVNVHHAVEPIIDSNDPIKDFYYLQISTAGIERELRLEHHFQRYIGSQVDIKFFAPLELGDKKLKAVRAVLLNYQNKIITINYEGEIFELDQAKCALVKSVE